MKQLIIILIFSLSLNYVLAQTNLVNNGSFEENDICPSLTNLPFNNGKILYCSNPNGGSPDYFNSCFNIQFQSFSIPSNFLGYQLARTGTAYIGLDIWDKGYFVSEYIQIKLAENLKQNHHYAFECYLSRAEKSRYSISNFGIHFAIDSVYYAPFEILPLTPQIINPPTNLLIDTTDWMPITGTFLANGGERFIILGSFNDSTQSLDTIYQYYGSANHRDLAYYYIDDVSLIDLDSALVVKENEAKAQVLVFPNPAKESINISGIAVQDKKDVLLSITDITGKKVIQAILIEKQPLSVAHLEAGIYFVKFQSKKGLNVAKFVKE